MRQHTIRWQLPYASLGEFISSHHAFVTQSGLYFKTAASLPLGAEAEFSITLDDGEEIISGKGRVAEVHGVGGGGPGGLAGVMLQFTDLSPQYNEVLLLIAAHRAVLDARRTPGATPKIREGLPDAVLGYAEPEATAVAASFSTTSSAAPTYASPAAMGRASQSRDSDDVAEEFFSSAPQSAPVAPPATSMAVPVAALPNEPKVPVSDEPKGTPPLPPDDHGEVSVTTPAGAIAGYAIDPSALAPEAGEVSGAARVGSTPPAQGMPVMRFSGEVQSVRTKMSAEAVSRVPRGDKPLPPPVGPIIGIDLGTTNTCASVVEGGRPIVIPSRRGYSTIPSMVALNEYGNLLVGHMARSQFLLNPVNTVYGAKRLIGRKFKSPLIQGLKNYFNYEVVEAPDGSTAVRLGGQVLTMPQVSALILMEIREIAQEYLQTPVNRAVISVPAYYNDSQRNAVRDAGRLAGFHVERIVNEPTAAALAYGFDKGLSQRIFVYDLGGGTFDASVLQLEGDVYEVLSTGGNNFLGGIDFDNRLADYFDEVFRAQHGVGLPRDGVTAQRVLFAAEQAKIALSDQPSYDVHVPYLMMHEGKSLDLKLTVTQQKLNELTDDLITRTLGVADGVLSARNIDPSSLDTILLVGGQSRLPRIRGRLAEHFARPIGKGVHPDESVALGAALLAHSLQRADAGLLLIDVLPISIGLALPDGRYARIIPRNTKLPSQKTFTIATTRDLQSEMTLVVLQGENDRYGDNDYLGTLRFDGITPAPMGKNQLRVTFAISNESTLTVTAFDGLSGKEIHATMTMRDAPEEVSMPRYGRPSGTAVEMVAIEATFPGKISDNPQRPATMRAPVLGGAAASTLPGAAARASDAGGPRRNLSAEELFGVSSDATPNAGGEPAAMMGAGAEPAQERLASSMPVVSPAASAASAGEKPRPASDLFDLDDDRKKKPGFWARMFGGKRHED